MKKEGGGGDQRVLEENQVACSVLLEVDFSGLWVRMPNVYFGSLRLRNYLFGIWLRRPTSSHPLPPRQKTLLPKFYLFGFLGKYIL